ncbi:MAG: PKD domain-containing protein [Bacteroidetes bacterium]|nr:PKD domain-containing protein [Bacteroidota bacterium]
MKAFHNYLLCISILCVVGAGCKKNSSTSACISLSISAPIVNQPVTFTDCSSNSTVSAWDFGDGTTGTGTLVQKTYAVAGSYTVTLVATTASGSKNTTTKTITVYDAPNARFNFGSAGCGNNIAGSPINFSVTEQQSGMTYLWNFGDGSTATANPAQHTYGQIGTYTVSLRISNSIGADSSTQIVSVANPFSSGYFSNSNGTSVELSDGGGNNFIMGRYPYYPVAVNAVVTSGLNFSIPTQTVYVSSMGNLTVHGHGYMVGAPCLSNSYLYIVDTIVSTSGTTVVLDTLHS